MSLPSDAIANAARDANSTPAMLLPNVDRLTIGGHEPRPAADEHGHGTLGDADFTAHALDVQSEQIAKVHGDIDHAKQRDTGDERPRDDAPGFANFARGER